ncbi:MAG: hypothetical protein KDA89_17890 [Planctomycetaceae bacterium]|nr:hypothetical protein [Planctomycetaceae bacterium]
MIQIQDREDQSPINAFCLNASGQIVAACGQDSGRIRIVDDNGTVVRSWKVAVRPESVSVAGDGTILVGGEGRLFRFDNRGKILCEAESPHMNALKINRESLRKEAVRQLTAATGNLSLRITSYERMLKMLEDKGSKADLNSSEKQVLEMLPALITQYKSMQKKQEEPGEENKGPSEDEIEAATKRLVQSKTKISSISAGDDFVYVATRAVEGYGYAVWKLGKDFTGGEIVLDGLSGCCGQMDVQACAAGLFVAENGRHRVVKYDHAGKGLCQWGKRDRTGIDGFTSCCNPMNVCFNSTGEVFTAESNTGRIKRFSSDGELLAYVGDVELVPGCKNVSIAVSPNSDRVYMLDLTRNHIVLMTAVPQPAKSAGKRPVQPVSATREKQEKE